MKLLVNVSQEWLADAQRGVGCVGVRLAELRDGSFDLVVNGLDDTVADGIVDIVAGYSGEDGVDHMGVIVKIRRLLDEHAAATLRQKGNSDA